MEMDLSTSSPSYSGKWQCLIVFNLHEFEHLKATTFVYKIEEKNIKPRLKKVTEVNFECEAEAAGGMINSLEWTLNGNVVKSENLNLPPKKTATSKCCKTNNSEFIVLSKKRWVTLCWQFASSLLAAASRPDRPRSPVSSPLTSSRTQESSETSERKLANKINNNPQVKGIEPIDLLVYSQ